MQGDFVVVAYNPMVFCWSLAYTMGVGALEAFWKDGRLVRLSSGTALALWGKRPVASGNALDRGKLRYRLRFWCIFCITMYGGVSLPVALFASSIFTLDNWSMIIPSYNVRVDEDLTGFSWIFG